MRGNIIGNSRRVIGLIITTLVCCGLLSLGVPQSNATDTQKVTLQVSQVVQNSGNYAMSDQVFKYQLTPTAPGNPLPAGISGPDFSFTIHGTDHVQLGSMTFNSVGLYTYKLSCVTQNRAHVVVDKRTYTIDIYVIPDQTPITVVYADDGDKMPAIEFKHIDNELPSVMLDVMQIVTNVSQATVLDGTFVYQLRPTSDRYPMPAGVHRPDDTFTITGTHDLELGPIPFAVAGVYIYKLSCIGASQPGFTIDSRTYTIEVFVAADHAPITAVYRENGTKAAAIEFVHVYGAGGGGHGAASVTGGSLLGLDWWHFLIAAAVLGLVVFVVVGRRMKSRRLAV